ncbi:hypothetical protein EDD21DRAFT_445992 [Dissophora ornata]|nr:hypothetical protein EDD21DRAFT_445992 [Dissophora ornata]
MENGGFHGQSFSAGSDLDDSSFLETSSSTTTAANSTRRYPVAGVIRSIFHAVLVQDTEHLDHVLSSLSLDPNTVRDREGKTMLMVAATENKHRVLRHLLTLPSIDVDLRDDEGDTALYQASAAGSTECVRLLLLAGASARQGNEESITPLIIASYNGFIAICRLLITVGHADVNQQDNTQKSALLLASYAGHVDVMAELIDRGATLNTLDQYGWSSLMLAAYAGELEACKLLLAHGADPHIRTANGKNARTLSWDAGHKSIAVYISKFLSRGNNASSSLAAGSGSMSSRAMIQQILPPVPRSPSRRTHSPAPSLPSVPEEGLEEAHYGTHRSSFSTQNTISRQSALSSRRNSRRPHPIMIPTASPRTSVDEPVSPIPTAMAPSHLVNIFNTSSDGAFVESSLDEASSSLSGSLARGRSIPAILPTTVPTSSVAVEKPTLPVKQPHPKTPTKVYTVHRRGIFPRHGSRQVYYYSESQPETQPETTTQAPGLSSSTSDHYLWIHGRPSKSHSEHIKVKDMEDGLNRRVVRRKQLMSRSRNRVWVILSKILTVCCPNMILPTRWSKDRRQDWREKVAVGVLVTGFSLLFGFVALGLPLITCRPHAIQNLSMTDFNARYGNSDQAIDPGQLMVIGGTVYNVGRLFFEGRHPSAAGSNITQASLNAFLDFHYGTDVSYLFSPADLVNTCQLFGAATSFGKCSPTASVNHCHQTQASRDMLQDFVHNDVRIAYQWMDVLGLNAQGRSLFIYDGAVFDATDYLTQVVDMSITAAERTRMDWIQSLVGKDATLLVQRQPDYKDLSSCFQGFFKVGVLSGQTNGCLASIVINMLTLAILLLITILRLASAVIYQWTFPQPLLDSGKTSSNVAPALGSKGDTHVLMLVTCRASDNEDRIKATLDALVLNDYDDSRKLLLVITDETRSNTGELNQASLACLKLLNTSALSESGNEKASESSGPGQDVAPLEVDGVHISCESSFGAAGIRSGHYATGTRRVPYILIISPPDGADRSGPSWGSWEKKRLVINWLSSIYFNVPISAFEFSLVEKIRELNTHGPQQFEMLLTTEVGSVCDRRSLSRMVETLENNRSIMGAAGQGLVRNGTQNWLTRIQDYESQLSLQFTNAFESTLGAVQCLPSKFSLIRIKTKRRIERQSPSTKHTKHNSGDTSIASTTGDVEDEDNEAQDDGHAAAGGDDDSKPACEKGFDKIPFSVPILIHPDVVSSFVGHKTRTLHERSLILDGAEDRYLTSLLHQTFPDRQVVYLPHATYQFAVTADLWSYIQEQRLYWACSFHNFWSQMWSSDLRDCSINFLAFLEWLHLVLLPIMVVMTWVLLTTLIVGATTNIGALYSLPVLLALAFVLSATALQPILCIFLRRRREIATSLVSLCLFLMAIPFKCLAIPIYACWHFDELDSSVLEKQTSGSPEPSAVELPQQAITTDALRRWTEWNSMRRISSNAMAPQDPVHLQGQQQEQQQDPF